MEDQERILTLRRAGLGNRAIAAILDIETGDVNEALSGAGALPAGGGGGSNVVHATNVPDQTVTLLVPGQPQDLTDLWRVEGPGLWTVAIWYEVKPADDDDYAGMSLIHETESGGLGGVTVGPDARTYTEASEILPGGWIRESATLGGPLVLTPTQWRDYKLQVSGWHYHDDDPGDTTTPVLGDVEYRNVRVVAVRLDA